MLLAECHEQEQEKPASLPSNVFTKGTRPGEQTKCQQVLKDQEMLIAQNQQICKVRESQSRHQSQLARKENQAMILVNCTWIRLSESSGQYYNVNSRFFEQSSKTFRGKSWKTYKLGSHVLQWRKDRVRVTATMFKESFKAQIGVSGLEWTQAEREAENMIPCVYFFLTGVGWMCLTSQ